MPRKPLSEPQRLAKNETEKARYHGMSEAQKEVKSAREKDRDYVLSTEQRLVKNEKQRERYHADPLIVQAKSRRSVAQDDARKAKQRERYHRMDPEKKRAILLVETERAREKRANNRTPEQKAKYEARRDKMIDKANVPFFDPDMAYWLTAKWFKG